jgi:RimJ/RimL family protein N-acetyltransferase
METRSWPGIEVGWIVAPHAWNRGYATEIGQAVRGHAFEHLGIEHLISVIGADNLASIRVAEKIGSTFEQEFDLGGTPQVIYGQRAPSA